MTKYDNNPFAFVDDSIIHGRGLFARLDLPGGTLIGHYAGPQTEHNGMHVLWVEVHDDTWLGYDGRNELRFVNHANEPNGEMDGRDLYALRTIKKGEEITIDYGQEFAEDLQAGLDCE